jgi:hypothetical protein
MNTCRACGSNSIFIFEGLVFSNRVKYFECDKCGYVQTEKPYWLSKAYEKSINKYDTGVLRRNNQNLKIMIAILIACGRLKGKILDFAGGHGILVRLLRDYGVNAFWQDKHSENLYAQGFSYDKEEIDLISAFEVFEHLEFPHVDVINIITQAQFVLISTEIMPKITPTLKDWNYYGVEHGQHIGFYRVKTLVQLAELGKMNLVTDGKMYHLFSKKKINETYFKFFIKTRCIWYVIGKIFIKNRILNDQKIVT